MQLGYALGSICLITCYGFDGVLYWTTRDTGYLVPPELGSLAGLNYLELLGNRLTGPIPSELGNLSNLSVLYLGWDGLTGPIPSELGNLSSLSFLYMGWSDLTGPIPAELTTVLPG
ncbi:MAG: hypothetical protein F4Z31_19710 [Gemmatimonadetes bacterium]|nr:hypothetical protein [Gemmatimonadota bacterium]MYE71046.1 hypothetical protein [Gemmatimonadota bacterium]